jgi:hypothetical protein
MLTAAGLAFARGAGAMADDGFGAVRGIGETRLLRTFMTIPFVARQVTPLIFSAVRTGSRATCTAGASIRRRGRISPVWRLARCPTDRRPPMSGRKISACARGPGEAAAPPGSNM